MNKLIITLILLANCLLVSKLVEATYRTGFESGSVNEYKLVEYCQAHKNMGEPTENHCVESLYGTDLETEITKQPQDPTFFQIIKHLWR